MAFNGINGIARRYERPLPSQVRFLLITIGSHGDVHPFLALGRALKQRGHEVALATNPYFEQQIAREGLHPVALTEFGDLKELMSGAGAKAMNPHSGPIVVLRDLMLPMVPQIVENTRRAIAEFKPDAAVIHHFCLGARWPCEQKGVPTAVCALSPCTWFNTRDKIVMPSFRGENPGPLTVKFDVWAGRVFIGAIIDRTLNRIRREMGMSAGKHWMHREPSLGDIALGLWSPHFRAPLPGDPAGSTVCGFPWHDRDEEREGVPDWEHFLNDGEPPLVFCLGTAAVHTAGKFYHDAAEACRTLNRRGMLLVGRTELLNHSWPKDVRAFAYAPFSRLFPRAAVNIHHGGIGSTGQALRAGKPTLICPLSHDQYDNAARCARLGVSRTLKHAKVSPGRMADSLRSLLEEPSCFSRAAAFGAKIAAEDGAALAAAKAEELGRIGRAGRA